jgi:ArsR family transcriptional regulator
MRDFLKATRALSDETRLRILNLLLERECCVCEVMQALDISQTRASRNLNILYDAGFLTLRKEGLWSLYSIRNKEDAPTYFPEIIEAIKKGLKGNRVAIQDREHLKTVERIGPTCAERQRRR